MGNREMEVREGYTSWHSCFYEFFAERQPGDVATQSEVGLSRFPSRADMVVVRRRDGRDGRDEMSSEVPARVFPLLWPHLSDVTVIEFKSPVRGFRSAELLRFMRYGLEYHELNYPAVRDIDRVTRVLIVPELNKALREELVDIHAELEFFGAGYARLRGSMLYSTFVLFTNEIAEAENDEFLKIFSHHKVTSKKAAQWLQQWMTRSKLMQQDVQDLEGHDEMLRKFLEALTPEELHLLPDEQLQMLMPMLSAEQLRLLTAEQLRMLSAEQLRMLTRMLTSEQLRLIPPEQIVDAMSDEDLDVLIALAAERRKH